MKRQQMGSLPSMRMVSNHNSILIVGLGNPILGDDGAGWRVATEILSHLRNPTFAIEVDCVSLGGLSLMERMLGYRNVILIDTMQTGNRPPGTVTSCNLTDLVDPIQGHTASAHDASLSTALATAAELGAEVPIRVDVVTIEAQNCRDFTEELTPAIMAAVPIAVQEVLALLSGITETPFAYMSSVTKPEADLGELAQAFGCLHPELRQAGVDKPVPSRCG